MSLLEDLWNTIKDWKQRNATHYLYERLKLDPAEKQTDEERQTALDVIEADKGYFRLWLKEMFLTDAKEWFTEWHPAVASMVKLKFGDEPGVHLANVSQPPEGKLSKGVFINYRLTELVPFRGGTVEIDAGLMALKGADAMGPAVRILHSFSALVTAPLAPVLSVAEKIASGMQELVKAKNGQVHLSLHDTFTSPGGGGTTMGSQYLAVILADAGEIDSKRLSVKKHRLHYRKTPNDPPAPLEGYDYMLFYIETRVERDDWRLQNIQQPLEQAQAALVAGEKDRAETLLKQSLIAAMTSPDLAIRDRRRVATAIKAEYDEIAAQGLGVAGAGGKPPDLNQIMGNRAIPYSAADQLPELTYHELFG